MKAQPVVRESADERQITSAVLQVRPECHDSVALAVREELGAEVIPTEVPSRIALVMEAETLGDLAGLMDRLGTVPGVVNATLVYHHVASADELDETIEVAPSTSTDTAPAEETP